MAIIGLQRRIREIGRIRLGYQGLSKDNKRIPKKLSKFRVTSEDRTVVEAVAGLYGGSAEEWDNDGTPSFEVFTETNAIPVYLPPAELAFSQWWEQWAKGFCVRRCDGDRDLITDGPCTCDPEDRDCSATTRLSVILRDLARIGVFRAESHGWNSAVELAGIMDVIGAAGADRTMLPATLRVVPVERRKLVEGKALVRKYPVLAVDLDMSVTELAAGGPALDVAVDTPRLPAGNWTPVPEEAAPALSIEDQLARLDEAPAKPERKNARAPVPSTGRPPTTAAQRAGRSTGAEVCPVCGEPYGGQPLVVNRDGLTHEGVMTRYVHRSCHDGLEADPPDSGRDESGGGEPDAGGEPVVSPPAQDGTVPEPRHTGSGDRPTTAAADRRPKPSAKQHSKIFALLGEVHPEGISNDEVRRSFEMTLCDALGSPGLTSHNDIDKELAGLVIDALEGIKAGTYRLEISDDEPALLVNEATGTLVEFGTGQEQTDD